MRALGQGYGLTEDETQGTLLETNVTVITNEECRRLLRERSNTSRIVTNLLTGSIPYGLDDQFLCARGMQNEEVSQTYNNIKNI